MVRKPEMELQVVNHGIQLGNIQILDVSSSSLVLIGDAQSIVCTAQYDEPSAEQITQPIVPLTTPEER